MNKKFLLKSDFYKDFILCVKFEVPRHEETYYGTSYEELYQQLDDLGWLRDVEIERIREDINYEYSDCYMGRGNLLKNTKDERIVVLQHETGPEFWMMSITSFIGGAIASGVIGNAAYDLLRKLYTIVNNTRLQRRRYDRGDEDSHRLAMKLRTEDFETIDLSKLPADRQQEIIERTIIYRMIMLKIMQESFPGDNNLPSLEIRVRRLEQQVDNINKRNIDMEANFGLESRLRERIGEELEMRLAELERIAKVNRGL